MSEEFWRASSDFWECVYRSTAAERDEAREIARELAAACREIYEHWPPDSYRPGKSKSCLDEAWLAIRPGVRKWLEKEAK